MNPFLKWVGGKRWLVPLLKEILSRDQHYYEPFVGSGACFFGIHPAVAFISDKNPDLVSAFNAVKHRPNLVIERVSMLQIDTETFARMREPRERGFVDKAVRMIYLNKTAFNGIYRVNRSGVFNVPFGCKPKTVLCDEQTILECSNALSGAIIRCLDFEEALHPVTSADQIYVDPPYTARHCNGSFRRYNEALFSWQDQLRLAACLKEKAAAGTSVVVSNSASDEVQRLYPKKYFAAATLKRPSNLAASSSFRGTCFETIIVSRNLASRLERARRIHPSLFSDQ